MKKNTKATYSRSSLNQPTSVDIPRFSLKGAIVVGIFALAGSLLFPLLFIPFNNQKLGIVIGNITFTAFGVVYARHFIETKRGFSRKFIFQYIFFAIALGVISYYWMYINLYI